MYYFVSILPFPNFFLLKGSPSAWLPTAPRIGPQGRLPGLPSLSLVCCPPQVVWGPRAAKGIWRGSKKLEEALEGSAEFVDELAAVYLATGLLSGEAEDAGPFAPCPPVPGAKGSPDPDTN